MSTSELGASLYSVTGECISIDLESRLLKGVTKASYHTPRNEPGTGTAKLPVYNVPVKDFVKVVTVVLRMYYGPVYGGPIIIFIPLYLRLNRCRGCIPEVRGFRTD